MISQRNKFLTCVVESRFPFKKTAFLPNDCMKDNVVLVVIGTNSGSFNLPHIIEHLVLAILAETRKALRLNARIQ